MHAAFADSGLQPVGQAGNEIGQRRLFECEVDRRLVELRLQGYTTVEAARTSVRDPSEEPELPDG